MEACQSTPRAQEASAGAASNGESSRKRSERNARSALPGDVPEQEDAADQPHGQADQRGHLVVLIVKDILHDPEEDARDQHSSHHPAGDGCWQREMNRQKRRGSVHEHGHNAPPLSPVMRRNGGTYTCFQPIRLSLYTAFSEIGNTKACSLCCGTKEASALRALPGFPRTTRVPVRLRPATTSDKNGAIQAMHGKTQLL